MIPNLVMLGSFLLSFLLIVLAVTLIRFWRRRRARRSPLHGKKLAHLPGQQLVTRITEHGDDLLLSAMLMYFTFPVVLLAWSMSRVDWSRARFGITEFFFLLAGFVLFAWSLVDRPHRRRKAIGCSRVHADGTRSGVPGARRGSPRYIDEGARGPGNRHPLPGYQRLSALIRRQDR